MFCVFGGRVSARQRHKTSITIWGRRRRPICRSILLPRFEKPSGIRGRLFPKERTFVIMLCVNGMHSTSHTSPIVWCPSYREGILVGKLAPCIEAERSRNSLAQEVRSQAQGGSACVIYRQEQSRCSSQTSRDPLICSKG